MAGLSLCALAEADFSYTQTRKTTGGMMASMAGNAGPQASKISFKGQKIRMDDGKTATIIDLEAQTITTIDTAQKKYTVKSLQDVTGAASDVSAKMDVKETGRKKVVNGFNANEMVLTMEVNSPQARGMGPMQMEMEMWISPDVPGASEVRDFYKKNGDKFPWRALAGGANPSMASAIAELQKKMSTMNGVMVEQVIRVKAPAGMGGMARGGAAGSTPAGPSAAQMQQMQAGMEKARAQLEAMAAQGGPAAEIAKQQLARMGPAPGAGGAAPASPASSGSLMEMTMDSSDFSTAKIPDSVFTVPEGYTKN